MIDVVLQDRVVVMLGRGRVHIDPAAHVARAADRRIPLLVLTLGYPVSERQRAFVTRAIHQAFEARVPLDAQIVFRPSDLSAHLGPGDEITVVATGREERRIGSALTRLPS